MRKVSGLRAQPQYQPKLARARMAVKAVLSACVVALAFGAGGCGKPGTPAPQGAADAQLQQSILNLQSGKAIHSISQDAATPAKRPVIAVSKMDFDAPKTALTLDDAVSDPNYGQVNNDFGGVAPAPELSVVLLCASVPHPLPGAPEDAWRKALESFGDCLRAAMVPVELARGALLYQVTYARGVTEKALSKMTDPELTAFLKAEFVAPGLLAGFTDEEAPKRLKLRDRFEDRDLDEAVRLARNLTARLSVAETEFFKAVDANRALVEHFATTIDRYNLLLLVRDAAKRNVDAQALHLQIATLLEASKMQTPKNAASFPVKMLRPWTIVGIAPDAGRETESLHDPIENPYHIVQRAMAQFGGPLELVSLQRTAYVKLRQYDNPPMPEHAAPHPQAARVAVVDTGIDFLKYPDLAEFLSNGRNGSMESYDFQDNDSNPYLRSEGADAHGTGTMASVLTILSHYAPAELLRERRVDIAMWKLNTIRDTLSTPYLNLINWQSREAMPDALIRQATDPRIALKPKIVSISAIFQLQPFLMHSNHPDAVLKAPWLWVMAAGNEGLPADQDKIPVCLSDVPQDKRVDERILCVGALRRGPIADKIAGYSNYGSRVDLYAYESYIDLCPNGTSCSTPAVSGAAAAVAAKYPNLSPEAIKEILVEAAESRTLEVDDSTAPVAAPALIGPSLGSSRRFMGMTSFNGPEDSSILSPNGGGVSSAQAPMPANSVARAVRVLDPATMMPRVLQIAEQYNREHASH